MLSNSPRFLSHSYISEAMNTSITPFQVHSLDKEKEVKQIKSKPGVLNDDEPKKTRKYFVTYAKNHRSFLFTFCSSPLHLLCPSPPPRKPPFPFVPRHHQQFPFVILHSCSISCPTPPPQLAVRSPPPPSPHTPAATSVSQKRLRRRGQPLCCTRPTTQN